MLLKFCYDKAQVIRALRFHFLNRGEIRVFGLALFLLVVFALAGFLFHLVTFAAMVGVLVMMAILGLAFWYLLPISIYNRAATFQESINLRFNEEGMIIGTQSGEKQVLWRNFHRVVETEQFFFLYRTNQSFFLIPMTAFDNLADRESFTRMLQTKIY